MILRDTNNDGTADMRMTYAQGLAGVYGIAFQNGYVYFGKNDSVVRVPYKNGDTRMQATPEKLITLPTGGHSTRNILFSKDGKKLYVAVGSASNKSAGEDPIRAA